MKGKWPSEYNREEVLTRITNLIEVPPAGDINSNTMSPVNKVIHAFIKDNVVPRGERKNNVGIIDAIYVQMLLKGKKLHLPWIMCEHMKHIRATPKHALTYALCIKKILQRVGMYQECDRPQKVGLPLDMGAMHRMKLDWKDGCWVPIEGKQEEETEFFLKKGFHDFSGSTSEDVMNALQRLENTMIDMVKALLDNYKEREKALLRKMSRLQDDVTELKLGRKRKEDHE